MKRAKVSTLAPPANPQSAITAETLYTVSLGNSVVVRFRSHRHAKAFQAEATRWLSAQMMSANLLLIEAFAAYRMAWPYLPAAAQSEALGDLVLEAHRSLDHTALESAVADAVFRRWKALNNALNAIRELAICLRNLYRERTEGVQRHQMEVMLERCNAMIQALRDYGTEVDVSHSHRPSPYVTV